ncbi:MAG: ribonuclease R [Hyphomicrobiaceae bacterium]|nr:ribonuclease R [Hyphomicrobiaceae bacterium]
MPRREKPPRRRSDPSAKDRSVKPGRRQPSGARAADPQRAAGEAPSKEEILRFLATSPHKVGKREIARAFGLKGEARVALKQQLAEMSEEGLIAGDRKDVHEMGGVPTVTVLEITGHDDGGDLVARPAVWNDEEGPRPDILVLAHAQDAREPISGLAVGDRILARISRLDEPDVAGYRYEAAAIRKLAREKRRLLGIFRADRRGGGTIEPIDRKALRAWTVQGSDAGKAKDGDLVRYDLARAGRFANPQAKVIECLGNPGDQRQISLIAIHTHGIPDDFPEAVIAEAERLAVAGREGRTDLTGLPLVTIDPADARDHDDAVHALRDDDPRNPGGFVVTVAIADVAHYVRPGSRLDREALLRGNSVYFPDRVVPMLPERISNDLCSLVEGQPRACLAVRMIFDKSGTKRGHTFLRGLMRSAAKLSYQEAQAAIDGAPSDKARPLLEPVLEPLWAAYAALAKARDERGPLDLDLPERKIVLDGEGRVARVVVPERLTAHRLIEEMMIQANVAAAEELERRRSRVVVYRCHEPPSKEKLKSLREFLESLDLKLPPAGQLRPQAFNRVLAAAKSLPVPELVNEVVLRSQSQAVYAPDNVGHFGLNLARYAHFTSPIRRYADLIVHRALISALGLGDGGLAPDADGALKLGAICEQISQAERRAMAAERETTDRLVAAHLADKVGAVFNARVSGVTGSGLFVRLAETGADGFVPASSLAGEYFHYVEAAHAMVGSRSGLAYSLGDAVEVKLVEAIATAGALRFEMVSEGKPARPGLVTGQKGRAKRLNLRQRGKRPAQRGRH